jgi:hypothetical protein
LLVEAKGYPSKNYRDPRRSGEVKPTNPTNQAQQWYSHALLKVVRLQTKNPLVIEEVAAAIRSSRPAWRPCDIKLCGVR